jgi:hypothetical protein
MPTLSASPGAFTLSGGYVGAGLAAVGLFALAGGGVTFTRSYNVDLGNIIGLKLDTLKATSSYFDKEGHPTAQMQQFDQQRNRAIERSFASLSMAVGAIQAAYDAAAQASAAASEAQAVVATVNDAVAAVQSVVDDIQSGDYNFTSISIGGAKFVNNDGSIEPYLP